MVNKTKGPLFKRKDDKYLIDVSVDLAEDSMFPFKTNSSVPIIIGFNVGDNKLKIEKCIEKETECPIGKQPAVFFLKKNTCLIYSQQNGF